MSNLLNDNWISDFKFSPMWNQLNEAQQSAVALPNKNSLVLAGAGSGKTKTLVARIAALKTDGKLNSNEILALTFTNKAAFEMRERIESSLDYDHDIEDLMVGTFHSVCLEIIMDDIAGFGYKKHANVISEDEQKALVERMFRDKGWDAGSVTITKFNQMIKEMSKTSNRKQINPINEFVNMVNRYKEKGLRAEQMSPKKISNFEIFRTMYKAYEKHLKEENSIDFAELLILVRERLINDKEFNKKYSGKWKIILVDEFQDTNPLQYELLDLLVEKGGAIFAVGDDDQSIYAFRGARVQNIFDFKDRCEASQVVKLEQNYRCSKNILNVANDIIKGSSKRLGKELWTNSDNGELVFVNKLQNTKEEAEFIAKNIETKWKLSGVPPEDIAILYRNNKASQEIEEALLSKGIPYRVIGGLSFLDKKEVKMLLAHAKCLISLSDINALTKATSFPKSGIGKKRLDTWRNIALEKDVHIEQVIDLLSYPKSPSVNPDIKALEFWEKIKNGRDGLIKLGLRDGLDNYLKIIKFREEFEDQKNYMERMKGIDAILNSLGSYEEDGGKDLEAFVNNILMLDTMADDGDEAIWLSSIHASKGLEFSHVYLCGWDEGVLPNRRAVSESETAIDEERRLAYVAVTRAKNSLTITFNRAKIHMKDDNDGVKRVELLTPSRYFSDIDPKYFTLGIGLSWPPNPLPKDWGKYQGFPTGDAIRRQNLHGGSKRYAPDGYELTKGSPLFKDESIKNIKKENITGLEIADFVKHKRHGIGKVISFSNENDQDKLIINVEFEHGLENLLFRYTTLEKVMPDKIKKNVENSDNNEIEKLMNEFISENINK